MSIKDLKIDNEAIDRRKTSNVSGITIIRIAAFAFAMVSWKATADGLSNYVFKSGWQAGLISFAIQAILFVFNLKLPFYIAKIGALDTNRKKKKYHFGARKGEEKNRYKFTKLQWIIIGFYCLVLCSSSFFSFVYICNYVVYEHQSGYVDDNVVLTSSYRKVVKDTYSYIIEDTKAMQVLASKLLGELNNKYPGEQKNDTLFSKEELISNVSVAQDAYDIAEGEYSTAKDTVETYKNEMESYAISRNATTWHDRQDEWEEKYTSAKTNWKEAEKDLENKKNAYENVKKTLTEAKKELDAYKDSKEKIIAEFLMEMLKANPNPDVLEQYMTELNNTIAELGTNDDVVENYSELVASTQTITAVVKDYLSLVEATSDKTVGINAIMKEIGEEMEIPNPDSKTFEKEYSSWKKEWHTKLSNLENLIQHLPEFSKSEKEELGNTIVNTELLENYNINDKIDELDELRRSKVSDINIIVKTVSLLFSKYWGIAWFSLGLAVFFDIASMLAGLFIYGVSKRK